MGYLTDRWVINTKSLSEEQQDDLRKMGVSLSQYEGEACKFFNLGEPDAADAPTEPPLVTVKMDGSLGILYRRIGDHWYAADCQVLDTLPPHLQAEARAVWDDLHNHFVNVGIAVVDVYHHIVQAVGTDSRKAFAIEAQKHGPYLSLLMQEYEGRNADIAMYVYKERFGRKPRPLGPIAPC